MTFLASAGAAPGLPALSLSANQAPALRLMADGQKYAGAAHRLGISESALKARLASARLTLGVETTCAAVACAVALGLIVPAAFHRQEV